MSKPKSLRARLTLTTAMAGALLVSYGGRTSYAGTCVGAGGFYVCSGGAVPGEAGVSIDYGGPVTVTTSSPPAGFGIDTTGTVDTAISIKADGGLTFNDTNTDGSIITGAEDGLYAKNENGGALAITTKGPLTGLAGDGIEASNDADGTSLTISAAAVSGGAHGILAENRGTGGLTITADGPVTGSDAQGIEARISNAANGGDLTVTTNDVNAGSSAIDAVHDGTGSIEITANGTVNAGVGNTSSGVGIIAVIGNDGSTGDITVSADDVTGKQAGIEARNQGTGSITVTADGLVTSTNVSAAGIRAENFRDGDITISAAAVDGGRVGILASNRGDGSIYVTATGTVTGRAGDGILAADPAGSNGLNVSVVAADVRGGLGGIVAQNIGTGFLLVTADNVTGEQRDGIRGSLVNGTDATISAGNVSAGRTGIVASNTGSGILSITAANVTGGLGGNGDGILAGLGSDGDTLTISAAAVGGAGNGINAVSEGTGALSVTTSGPVFGASADGIFAKIDNAASTANLTVSTAGVTGAANGIVADHQGLGDIVISASGLVEGIGDDGIKIVNTAAGGAVTIEADAVAGGRSGIRAEHLGTGALSITADGDVTGDTAEGIFAKIDNAASEADLTISAMGVSGGTDGIDAKNLGSGSIVVTTSGPVTANGDGYGIRVGNFAGGDVSIAAGDTVTAPGTGIAGRNYGPMAGNVTITAAGVTGRTGIVASTSGSGSVSVTATGTVIGTAAAGGGINALNTGGTDISISTVDVIGGARGISARNTGIGSTIIDANGTVTGLGDIGIYGYNGAGGGDITVSAMDVDGGNFGILARSQADGSISVTASGDVTGAFSDGIRADAASLNATQVTVAAQSVFGAQRGIDARNNGTDHLEVVAEGTVTGGQNEGIRARITNTDSGGDLTVSAASVSGGTYGIFAENQGSGDFRISASGTVAGTERDGIRAINSANGAGLTISAAGVIGGDYGIFASNQGTGALSVTTTGLVSGGPYGGIVARNSNGGVLGITAMDTVTSTGGAGVFGYNGIGGTALTISAAAGANGGNYGIFAENQGSGDFRISASGTVAGTERDGIRAINSANGAGLTISAASVIGGGYGIFAKNEGDAELSVTTTGLVSGGVGDGIVAWNYNGGALNITATETVVSTGGEGIYGNNFAGTTSLTISAAGVSASQYGIIGRNYGIGDFTVTATGLVTSTIGAGIFAENLNGGAISINAEEKVESTDSNGISARNLVDTTDLTIVAASISAGKQAIEALNEGTGDLDITTTGPATGGTYGGIVARNFNGGALGITAMETVTAADGAGMYARNGIDGTNLTISTDAVSGESDGIFAENAGSGLLSITSSGTVTGLGQDGIDARDGGTVGQGITVRAQTVHGDEYGISATGISGNISVTADETVRGERASGIRAELQDRYGTGDITVSAADVHGGNFGIIARSRADGSVSVSASGPIVGLLSAGVRADGGSPNSTDVTVDVGDVSGGQRGIDTRNLGTGHLTVIADGLVTGGSREGIRAQIRNVGSSGNLTVSAADVTGGSDGILALNRGTGALTITATGTVTGGMYSGITATIDNPDSTGNLSISAVDVTGNESGIVAENRGSGDLIVFTKGSVEGGTDDGMYLRNANGGALSVTAAEHVASAEVDGIRAINYAGGSSMTISTASVSGFTGGIIATNAGTGDIAVTATGEVSGGPLGDGMRVRNLSGGSLSITTTALVSSGPSPVATGIFAENRAGGTDLSISATDVFGNRNGITARHYGDGALNVTTTGSVTGATGVGIRAYNLATGSDLTISAASVFGSESGIEAMNRGTGALMITATGAVTADVGTGIVAAIDNPDNTSDVSLSVVNVTGNQSGVVLENGGVGHLSITADGQVTGVERQGILANLINPLSGGDLTISAASVFGGENGIETMNRGTGALMITATGTVAGGTSSGIVATVDNPDSTGDLSISVVDVTGNESGIALDNGGKGQFFMTIDGAVAGNVGPGIGIVDLNDSGGVIVIGDTGSVASDAGLAISDQDGSAVVVSRGALVDDVMLNGGADEARLIDGSATGLIGLGSGDDTMEIFGVVAGGGWDDADFSGTFDGNLGQVLQIDGGDGLDTVELFGVTAASQALGVPTGLEALALSANTLVQANDADLTPFGAVFVDATSTLQAEGNSPSNTVVGSLGNEGVVDLADGEANDVLRVTGDYAGATGSRVLLDLDADGATSDMFIIEGDVTDVSVGPFTVVHDGSLIDVNLIGRGSRTTGDGIRLIEVSGAVDGDDFALAGPVEGDLFGYELVFEDGAHFLRSDFFDQIYLYENLPGAMQTIGLALTGQLVERVGVRSAVPSALTGADGNPVAGGAPVDTGLWGRAVGLSVESEGDLDSVTGTSFDQTVGFLQAGVDVTVLERQSGRLLIGALGHWGTSSLDANTFDGDDAGSANFDFYGGGLTATWYSTQGWYFDNVVQYTAYDIDISTASRFATTSTDGYAITTSHEVGYRIPISETAALVPQAQLTYQHIDFDDFTDPDGVRISLDDGDSLIGRAGLAFENSAAIGSALATGYVEANVLYEFLGDNSVNVATGFGTTPISQETRGTSVELGFGGTLAVSRGVSLYAEVDYTIPFDTGVQGVQAVGGIRVNLNPPPPPPLPAPVIAPVAETAFIVFFDWDRADLTSEANLVLDDVVVVANQSGYASIRLDGYTDLSGSAAYNLGLSERRANSVADGLIARGIAPDEIVIRAFGEENPLVPTPDGVREPQNRRVEIFLS